MRQASAWVSHQLAALSPVLPRRDWVDIAPKSLAAKARRLLCVGVNEPVCGRLFTDILLVVPSHARLNLAQIAVHSVDDKLAYEPTVAIDLLALDLGTIPGSASRKRLFGTGTKRLPLLRGVNAGEPHLVPDVRIV